MKVALSAHSGRAMEVREDLPTFNPTTSSARLFWAVIPRVVWSVTLGDTRIGGFPFLPLDWDEPSALNGTYMSVSYSVEGVLSGIEGRMTTISRWDPGQISPVPEPGPDRIDCDGADHSASKGHPVF